MLFPNTMFQYSLLQARGAAKNDEWFSFYGSPRLFFFLLIETNNAAS